jgi:ribosomal-protein-alanine N-acetyltransferase
MRGSEVEVTIRPFRPEDASAVHRWFNNAEATASLMETRASFTPENAEGWTAAAVRAEGEDRKYAIEVEGVEEPVGFTALYGLFRQTAPELGALIGDPPGAKGVGREAERLTVAKAFEEFGAHRIYGRIPSFNIPAKKAVSWQGWQHEGTMKEHIRRPDGTLIDCEIWGITAAAWRERWRDEDLTSPRSS